MKFVVPANISDRRVLYGLDEAACERLARLWPITIAVLDAALDRVVAAELKMPTVAAIFEKHGRSIRAWEKAHYLLLLKGDFGEAYLQSCVDLTRAQQEIGLTARTRMFVGHTVEHAIMTALRGRWRMRAAVHDCDLVARAMWFDTAMTITCQQDAVAHHTRARQSELTAAIGNFEVAIADVIGRLSGAASCLSTQTGAIGLATAKTGGLTQSASTSATQSELNVHAALQATRELGESIVQIKNQSLMCLEASREVALETRRSMAEFQALAGKAARISSVTETISSIAAQTNMLALNATIEAARAGASGSGFAVVAQEVKALAAQTSLATQQISDQIAGVQTDSKAAVVQAGRVLTLMTEIDGFTSAIAAAITQQAAATQAISHTMRLTADGADAARRDLDAIKVIAVDNCTAVDAVRTWVERLTASERLLTQEVADFFRRVHHAA